VNSTQASLEPGTVCQSEDNWYAERMPGVEKVTVSLPAELLARIEERRAADGRTRSDVIAELLRRGWQAIDHEAMEEEYRRAYAAEPETAEESAWADAAAEEMFGAGAAG
jgi:metal-responsive CopG/Arc/MetJ family transcriptional regulator